MKILKTLFRATCVMSLALTPAVGWSQGGALTVKGDAETATQQNVPSAGPSVKDNSDKSKDSNKSGQAMSMLTGGMLIATGVPMVSSVEPSTVAMGVMLIGMGILSFAQGGAHGSSASGAGLTSGLTNGYADGSESGGGLVDVPTSVQEQANSSLANLASSGVYNPKTGKITANGKTYSASDFSSPAAMAAAGFSQGAISGAMAYGKKTSEKAMKKLGAMTAANGYAESGGGGGGGGFGTPSSSSSSDYDSGADYASTAAPSYTRDRDPSSLAGMQRNYNGDPIGVAADSIFLMMNRRYKLKESQQSFYDEMDLSIRK